MQVLIPSPLRSYTKRSRVEASGATLGALLDDLERQFPGIRFRMVDEQDRVRRHVRVFVAGEQCFDSALVGQAVQSTALREEATDRIGRLLTPREREILTMISSGLRNRAIGERLSISEGTVKLHLHHIYEKLEVDGRLELILYAQKHKLV